MKALYNVPPVVLMFAILSITNLIAVSIQPTKVGNSTSIEHPEVNTTNLSSNQKDVKVVERMETFQPEIRAKEALVIHNQKVNLLKTGE